MLEVPGVLYLLVECGMKVLLIAIGELGLYLNATNTEFRLKNNTTDNM